MEWTKKAPTEPGWYWLKHKWITRAEGEIVELQGNYPFLCFYRSYTTYISEVEDAEWAGPLKPPS